MREYTFTQAVRQALIEEITNDPAVFVLGEDIGLKGGVYGVTEGLLQEFGKARIIDTPVSETAIVGAAIGAALMGMKPVAEIMFCDFLACCYDQLANQASKWMYMSGGAVGGVTITIRVCCGAGERAASQHSQTNEGWFMNVPGLKIVYPSTPLDAYGLLKAAIQDRNPVLFYEHKLLYSNPNKDRLPDDEFTTPLGTAELKREGDDLTIITYGLMVNRALAVAERLSKGGVSVEILDLRTVKPLDEAAILRSVAKTGRVIILHEAPKTGGVGSEVAAFIAEKAFDDLKVPIVRVGGPDTPVPYSSYLEDEWLLGEDAILNIVKKVLATQVT